MLRLDKVIKPWKESASLNDHINLYGFWNETAFLTKSGDLGMVLSVPGVDYESLDRSQQEYAVKRLEAALKAFGPGFHVYQYLFKSNRPDIPFAKYDDPIVEAAIEQRRKFFEAKRDHLYQVEIFYCILLEGARSKTGVGTALARLMRDPEGAIAELKSQFTNDSMKKLLRTHIERDLQRLDQHVQAFARQLTDFMQIEILNRQAQFTFFRRLLNYDDWRVAGKPQSTQFLDHQVVNSDIEAERDHLRIGEHIVRVLTMKEAVTETRPLVLDALLKIPANFCVVTEWTPLTADKARKEVNKRRRHFNMSKTGFVSQMGNDATRTNPRDVLVDESKQADIENLGDCLRALGEGQSLGDFSLTIVLYGRSRTELDQLVAEFTGVFTNADGNLFAETYNQLNAYFATVPGNYAMNLRRLYLLNTNYADLSFLFTIFPGEKTNAHLGTEYLAVVETDNSTPYFLNLHTRDVAHTLILGMTGSGKTSVLKIFLKQLREREGVSATLLAAPTGKARVRLQAITGRSSNTIHQVLDDAGMLGPNYRILDEPKKGRRIVKNIVIDESSMPSVELLAALFRAVDMETFRRLIFVGDPYQLPPIGPGRPFVDALRWMREQHPECVAELKTCMRVTHTAGGTAGISKGLELAAAYRDETGPGDDAVLSELVQKGELADVQIAFWNDHAELLKEMNKVLEAQFGIRGDDEAAFARSLGIDSKNWKACENWQILSPTRIQPFGTDELNRLIQSRFRATMLSAARDPRTRWPSPMGDQDIVFNDKVMQTANRPKWLPKDAKGLRYVANGEIGIVTFAGKGKEGKPDYLRVIFSTQPESEYSYPKSDAKETLELAYALTVHKAQGSDFETVILIIPRKAQTLSRELLYTGLTRFKGKLILLVEKDSQPLLDFRRPEASDTMRRTTRMFKLLIGEDAGDIGIRGPYRPEGLIHRTSDGTPVRSKSEVIVYDVLTALGLSVRYEEPLIAKSGDPKDFRLPDFTIHYQGRAWYWEHLGMLTKASYQEDWELKQKWYRDNGYWDRVLTSKDHPGGIGGIVYADEIRKEARGRIFG